MIGRVQRGPRQDFKFQCRQHDDNRPAESVLQQVAVVGEHAHQPPSTRHGIERDHRADDLGFLPHLAIGVKALGLEIEAPTAAAGRTVADWIAGGLPRWPCIAHVGSMQQ